MPCLQIGILRALPQRIIRTNQFANLTFLVASNLRPINISAYFLVVCDFVFVQESQGFESNRQLGWRLSGNLALNIPVLVSSL